MGRNAEDGLLEGPTKNIGYVKKKNQLKSPLLNSGISINKINGKIKHHGGKGFLKFNYKSQGFRKSTSVL